jgi:hypothetical protein
VGKVNRWPTISSAQNLSSRRKVECKCTTCEAKLNCQHYELTYSRKTRSDSFSCLSRFAPLLHESAPVILDGVAQRQCLRGNPDAVKLGVKQLCVVQKETAKLMVGVRHFPPRRADHL